MLANTVLYYRKAAYNKIAVVYGCVYLEMRSRRDGGTSKSVYSFKLQFQIQVDATHWHWLTDSDAFGKQAHLLSLLDSRQKLTYHNI